uniref:Trichohyalin-like n=1 Tax=Caenorhabditis tropicalis TaxID=1561998 RepID=A0A1I7SZX1_9PELO
MYLQRMTDEAVSIDALHKCATELGEKDKKLEQAGKKLTNIENELELSENEKKLQKTKNGELEKKIKELEKIIIQLRTSLDEAMDPELLQLEEQTEELELLRNTQASKDWILENQLVGEKEVLSYAKAENKRKTVENTQNFQETRLEAEENHILSLQAEFEEEENEPQEIREDLCKVEKEAEYEKDAKYEDREQLGFQSSALTQKRGEVEKKIEETGKRLKNQNITKRSADKEKEEPKRRKN